MALILRLSIRIHILDSYGAREQRKSISLFLLTSFEITKLCVEFSRHLSLFMQHLRRQRRIISLQMQPRHSPQIAAHINKSPTSTLDSQVSNSLSPTIMRKHFTCSFCRSEIFISTSENDIVPWLSPATDQYWFSELQKPIIEVARHENSLHMLAPSKLSPPAHCPRSIPQDEFSSTTSRRRSATFILKSC